jgi:hypothetical protein
MALLSWRFISFLVGVLFYIFKDNFFEGNLEALGCQNFQLGFDV